MAETFASDAVRTVGSVEDVTGKRAVIGADCDAVTILVKRSPEVTLVLDAERREQFQRAFMEAERQAEAWQREHAGAADD